MPVEVRRATRDDARSVAEFAMKLFEQHRAYDPVRFAKLGNLEGMAWFYGGQTEADDAAVLVAELDGRVVGFAYLGYEPRNYAELSESSARLHDIYVDRSARGSGVGKLLIEASAEAARKFGAAKMLLSVAAQNVAGQRFFESSGFKTTMLEMMLVIGE